MAELSVWFTLDVVGVELVGVVVEEGLEVEAIPLHKSVLQHETVMLGFFSPAWRSSQIPLNTQP